MTYISYTPCPPLDAYLYDIHYFAGPIPYRRQQVVPMTSLNLIVNLGDPIEVYLPDQADLFASCADSCWVGLWSSAHVVAWPHDVRFFGVHFRPGGAAPFLRLPLIELHNQVVPLDILWGQFAAEIRERLSAAPNIQAGFQIFEQFLLGRLGETPYGLEVVQYAVETMARQHGSVSIRELSDDIGISQNHLGTQFKRMVGISAKELARFYRFEHAIVSINPHNAVDWAEIAHQARYYDQSHFNKDFVAFTGRNPTDYLRLLRRLHDENPAYAQHMSALPVE